MQLQQGEPAAAVEPATITAAVRAPGSGAAAPGAPDAVAGSAVPPSTAGPGGSYELVTLLALGLRSLIDQLHERLAAAGLGDVRPAYGFAFSRLAPDGATGQQLAVHLGVTRSAASQLVDEMAERGFVKRLPHPTDRRGKLVVLTGAGWECIRLTEAILADLEASWRDAIGDQRMTELVSTLRQLNAQMPHRAGRGLRPIW
jgi:DNA-binding MarR family transcriptional regulator